MSGNIQIVQRESPGTTDIENWYSLNPLTRDVYQEEHDVNVKKYDHLAGIQEKEGVESHFFFADDNGVVRQVRNPDSISVRFENGLTVSLDQYFYMKPLITAFKLYDRKSMATLHNTEVTRKIEQIFDMFKLSVEDSVALLDTLEGLNLDHIQTPKIRQFKDLIFPINRG